MLLRNAPQHSWIESISAQCGCTTLFQRTAKGASGKTSEIAKKRQKYLFSTLFDSFRTAPVFRPLLGGSDICTIQMKAECQVISTRLTLSLNDQASHYGMNRCSFSHRQSCWNTHKSSNRGKGTNMSQQADIHICEHPPKKHQSQICRFAFSRSSHTQKRNCERTDRYPTEQSLLAEKATPFPNYPLPALRPFITKRLSGIWPFFLLLSEGWGGTSAERNCTAMFFNSKRRVRKRPKTPQRNQAPPSRLKVFHRKVSQFYTLDFKRNFKHEFKHFSQRESAGKKGLTEGRARFRACFEGEGLICWILTSIDKARCRHCSQGPSSTAKLAIFQLGVHWDAKARRISNPSISSGGYLSPSTTKLRKTRHSFWTFP